jgi:hypothetical protein
MQPMKMTQAHEVEFHEIIIADRIIQSPDRSIFHVIKIS